MRAVPLARLLPAATLAGLLAAGCAGPAADPAAPAPATSAPATEATATAGAGSAPATTAGGGVAPAVQPDDPPATPVRVVASGRVEAAGGAGCLLLDSDLGRRWLLVGGDRAVLRAGARVRVVGRPLAARSPGCQQGEPLRVVAATPAG